MPASPVHSKKRVAAGALFFNERGEVLIVKPTYKDGWSIPGGIVEADESPRDACTREVREELGFPLPIGRLLAVDYTSADESADDSLQFTFDGGVLGPHEIKEIRLQADELSAFGFVSPEEGKALLRPRLSQRLNACITSHETDCTVYLHDGQEA